MRPMPTTGVPARSAAVATIEAPKARPVPPSSPQDQRLKPIISRVSASSTRAPEGWPSRYSRAMPGCSTIHWWAGGAQKPSSGSQYCSRLARKRHALKASSQGIWLRASVKYAVHCRSYRVSRVCSSASLIRCTATSTSRSMARAWARRSSSLSMAASQSGPGVSQAVSTMSPGSPSASVAGSRQRPPASTCISQ